MSGANQNTVCISQAHNAEKNHQVRSMGRIYALARKVHVWLGPAADEDALAVDELFWPGGLNFDLLEMVEEIHCRDFPDNLTPAFLSLEHFVSRSWFTRRWVLQEVCLGREVFVHCGERETLWKSFIGSVATLWEVYHRAKFNLVLHDRVVALREHVSNIFMMDEFTEEGRGGRNLDSIKGPYKILLGLLHIYDKTVCLDARDRLYSLYGLSTAGDLYERQQRGLAEYCAVDYSVHFSHAYTVFASGAVEADLFQYMVVHTLQFGSLADQEEIWPSWVPSWNLTRKMQLDTRFFNCLRPSPHLLETQEGFSLRIESEEDLWNESSICLVCMHRMRALQLRGCIHRICQVQSDTVHLDAISYFEAIARAQHTMSSPMVEGVVAFAMSFVPGMLRRPGFDLHSVYGVVGSSPYYIHNLQKLLLPVTRSFLGLPPDDVTKKQPELDRDKFASEARRILEGLESFCYEVEGSFTFGIALTQVKPGDFVFRTPNAASGKVYHTEKLSPSACGLIIRPYHAHSDAGPATFRLVGMCIDWYPDVKDPEFVEVVLV
jgi:hypothetical protein